MQNRFAALASVFLLLMAACSHATPVAAPAATAAAAAALARQDGPVAVDPDGRWAPRLVSTVRLQAADSSRLRLQAFDASLPFSAVYVAHDDDLVASGTPLVEGAGTTLVYVRPADGAVQVGGREAVGAAVALQMHADGRVDGRTAFEGTARALDFSGTNRVIVSELAGPLDGVEPWRATITFWGPDWQGFQVFGSDQPIHFVDLDASLDGYTFLTGSFAGTLGVGGQPPMGSRTRATFVAAFQNDAQIAWIAPIAAPVAGAEMEPLALRVREDVVQVGLNVSEPGGATRLLDARLGLDGAIAGACELVRSSRASHVRDLDLGDDLLVVAGHFGGEVAYAGQPATAGSVRPSSELVFFAPGCKLAGRLEAGLGEDFVGVRAVGTQVALAVAVDHGAAIELRRYDR